MQPDLSRTLMHNFGSLLAYRWRSSVSAAIQTMPPSHVTWRATRLCTTYLLRALEERGTCWSVVTGSLPMPRGIGQLLEWKDIDSAWLTGQLLEIDRSTSTRLFSRLQHPDSHLRENSHLTQLGGPSRHVLPYRSTQVSHGPTVAPPLHLRRGFITF